MLTIHPETHRVDVTETPRPIKDVPSKRQAKRALAIIDEAADAMRPEMAAYIESSLRVLYDYVESRS